MNNGPIAWTTKLPKTVQDFSFYRTQHYTEPLYTHPPQEPNCYGDGNVYRGVRSKDSEVQTIQIGGVRELTDEELDSIIASVPYPRTHAMDKHMIKLALKKASEK